MSPRRRTGFPLPLVLALLAACTSTEERFESAEQLAAQGRFADAAGEYIRILDKDPAFPGAREGLVSAGTEAVNQWLDGARSADSAGRSADAASLLDRLERLHDRAAQVGVHLPLPADYQDFRAGVDDSATLELVLRGRNQASEGRWAAAVRSYDQARAMAPDPTRALEIDALAAEAFVGWGEEEMDEGRFRSAAERFESAVARVPEGHHVAATATELRNLSFELGTRWTAFLPLFVVEEGRGAPPGFDRALNEALLFDYWSEPPLFVGQVDPGEQRRVLRREEVEDTPPGMRLSSRLGDLLDADLLVIVELAGFTEEERNARRRRRETTMEEPRRRVERDTAWVEVSATIRYTADVLYTLVDPITRDVIADGEISESASGRVEWGEFFGNPDHLDLSRSARDLFDEAVVRDQRRDIEEELIDELAEGVGDRVFAGILRTVR